MTVFAMRRRQYLIGGAGLVATGVMGLPVVAQDDESEDSEYSSFVSGVEAALDDVDATVVSHCECPRYSELVVTTQADGTDDETFHEEAGLIAGAYADFVERAESPPAFGVMVYVYESADAATESIDDPFAQYVIQTQWAEDVLESEDTESYLTQILLTVEPPIEGDNGDSDNEGDGDSETDDAQIEITDHELVHDDSGFSTETYVAATVENTGDGPTGEISIEASWYSEGDYLDADTVYLQTLGAGETWLARVEYLGSGGEDIDDYELEYEVEADPPSASDGLDLAESDMRVGEDEVIIEGRVENNTDDDQSYIQATAKLYNSDGAVLDDVWTNVTDVPEGETWAFDVSWFEPGRTEEVADYEIVISNRV